MIHFTWEGPNAGKPYCKPSKQNLPATDEFYHVPYDKRVTDQLLNDSNFCPKCKAIHLLSFDDTLSDDEWNKQYTAILKG